MSGSRIQGDIPQRTLEFSLQVLDLVESFPDGTRGWVIGKQLLRSGTSIGANVREAEHALTDAEFVQRCSIARKEASETEYWLRLSEYAGLVDQDAYRLARSEANELLRILSTIVRKGQARCNVSN